MPARLINCRALLVVLAIGTLVEQVPFFSVRARIAQQYTFVDPTAAAGAAAVGSEVSLEAIGPQLSYDSVQPTESCIDVLQDFLTLQDEILDKSLGHIVQNCDRIADAQLQALPILWVMASDALLEQAAAVKACHSLSVADAWIAAAARQEGAVLVHKDPEFHTISSLSQEWLG